MEIGGGEIIFDTFLLIALMVAIGVVLIVAYGSIRWASGTQKLRARIESARVPLQPAIVSFAEIEGLPVPVRNYFRKVLTEGRPMVTAVHVKHEGTFNMGQAVDRWKPFTSDQRIIIKRPGFDWNARIRIFPGLTVRVHDSYVEGEGILYGSLAGIFSVINLHGRGQIAESELMRFLAESPWYPTALLPSQGVLWEAVDANSARATLIDDSVALTMLFLFGSHGLIKQVQADARGRTVGKEIIPTPWQGRFWNYETHDGMEVPLEGEVSWLLPEGQKPYWRGRITSISYEFAKVGL